MTPEPFVKPERIPGHRYSDACACSTCTATFRRNVRSNGGNPHMYGAQKPFMAWQPIIVSLGWVLAAALVVLALLVLAGVWQLP